MPKRYRRGSKRPTCRKELTALLVKKVYSVTSCSVFEKSRQVLGSNSNICLRYCTFTCLWFIRCEYKIVSYELMGEDQANDEFYIRFIGFT